MFAQRLNRTAQQPEMTIAMASGLNNYSFKMHSDVEYLETDVRIRAPPATRSYGIWALIECRSPRVKRLAKTARRARRTYDQNRSARILYSVLRFYLETGVHSKNLRPPDDVRRPLAGRKPVTA